MVSSIDHDPGGVRVSRRSFLARLGGTAAAILAGCGDAPAPAPTPPSARVMPTLDRFVAARVSLAGACWPDPAHDGALVLRFGPADVSAGQRGSRLYRMSAPEFGPVAETELPFAAVAMWEEPDASRLAFDVWQDPATLTGPREFVSWDRSAQRVVGAWPLPVGTFHADPCPGLSGANAQTRLVVTANALTRFDPDRDGAGRFEPVADLRGVRGPTLATCPAEGPVAALVYGSDSVIVVRPEGTLSQLSTYAVDFAKWEVDVRLGRDNIGYSRFDRISDCAFSPSGQWVALAMGKGLYILRASDLAAARATLPVPVIERASLMADPASRAHGFRGIRTLAWTPDSSEVVFVGLDERLARVGVDGKDGVSLACGADWPDFWRLAFTRSG
ncbi:MAG: hypothetical protein IT518_14185, partial [Burkholderiales bacterium]|nr:hypothetical protein [Burkholderiales bacterium]